MCAEHLHLQDQGWETKMWQSALVCTLLLASWHTHACGVVSLAFRLFPFRVGQLVLVVEHDIGLANGRHYIECDDGGVTTSPVFISTANTTVRASVGAACSRRNIPCGAMLTFETGVSIDTETLLHGGHCALVTPGSLTDLQSSPVRTHLTPAPLRHQGQPPGSPSADYIPPSLPRRSREALFKPRASAASLSWVTRLLDASAAAPDIADPDLFAEWQRDFGGIPHLVSPPVTESGTSGGSSPESFVRQLLTAPGTAELVAAAMPESTPLHPRPSNVKGYASPRLQSRQSHRAAHSAAVRALAARWGDALTYAHSPHGRLKSVAERLLARSERPLDSKRNVSPSTPSQNPMVGRATLLLETIAGVFDDARKSDVAKRGNGADTTTSPNEVPTSLGARKGPNAATVHTYVASVELADLESLLLELAEASRALPQLPRPQMYNSAQEGRLNDTGKAMTARPRRRHSFVDAVRDVTSAVGARTRRAAAAARHARLTRWSESDSTADAEARLGTMLLEAHSQVSSLLSAGVRSKEIFALIVNQIMNSMPEIILQIVVSTVRTPITQLVALVLSVLLPPLLVPSSGAIAPTAVPGRGVPEQPPPLPPLPCVCKEADPMDDEAARFRDVASAVRCGCIPNSGVDGVKHPPAGPAAASTIFPATVLLEAVASFASTAQPASEAAGLADADADAWVHMSAYGGVDEAASSGVKGPIAHMEPKILNFVRDATEAFLLPHLGNALIERMKTPIVEMATGAVHRDLSRRLIQSLTAGIVRAAHASLQEAIGPRLIRACVKQLTADLTARLSPAIASSVAHSLSNAPANDYFCAICKAQSAGGNGANSSLSKKVRPSERWVPGSGSVGPPVEPVPATDDTGAYCGACAHAKDWDRRLDERIAEVSPAHVKAHVARALAAYDAAASPSPSQAASSDFRSMRSPGLSS